MTGDGQVPLDCCDVSDACDELGVEAVRTGAMRPLWPACPPISGRITTVRLEPEQSGETPLPELLDVLAGARDGIVLVDVGARLDVQCWGTELATAARRFGVRGALVNGAARDVAGLQELGFPTYARGVHPAQMRGRLRLAGVGVPVEIDGSVVEPGCFAVADASGAVFLPAARESEVVALAAEVHRREYQRLRGEPGTTGERAAQA
jgi:4-hydroxy-4-methyl-2-oxoglutarate aldolase